MIASLKLRPSHEHLLSQGWAPKFSTTAATMAVETIVNMSYYFQNSGRGGRKVFNKLPRDLINNLSRGLAYANVMIAFPKHRPSDENLPSQKWAPDFSTTAATMAVETIENMSYSFINSGRGGRKVFSKFVRD